MEKSYKETLPKINTFIFDVDGVLTNGMLTIMPDGEMIRHMNVRDGYALQTALSKGYRVCVITGGTNEGVRIRLQNLGITDIFLGAHHKITPYETFLKKYNIAPETVLYMGDDIPDLSVMKRVGLACCPNDAAPEIQQIATYISYKKGGEGCVRDVIEQTLRVQGKWDGNFDTKND